MSQNADTAELRRKQRRVKDHILTKFLRLAEEEEKGELSDKDTYKELLLTFARNVIPRSTEVTGEDGEDIKVIAQITGMKIIQDGDRVSQQEFKADTGQPSMG